MSNSRQRHLATYRELQSLLVHHPRSSARGDDLSSPSASTEEALVALFTQDAVLEIVDETYLGHEGVRRWIQSGAATGVSLQLLDSAPVSVSQDPRDGSVVAVTKSLVQHCGVGGVSLQHNFWHYEFRDCGDSSHDDDDERASSPVSSQAGASTRSLSKICRCVATGTTPLPQRPQVVRYYRIPIKPDCGPRAVEALGDLALPLLERFPDAVCHLASHFRLSTGTLHIAVVCMHEHAASLCAAQLDSEIFHALRLWKSPIDNNDDDDDNDEEEEGEEEASASPAAAAAAAATAVSSEGAAAVPFQGDAADNDSVRGSGTAANTESSTARAADDGASDTGASDQRPRPPQESVVDVAAAATPSRRRAAALCCCCPGVALRSRHGGISGPGCCAVLAVLPTEANGYARVRERLPALARRLGAIPGYLSLTVLQPADDEVHLISQYASPSSQLEAAAAIRLLWGDLLTDLLVRNPERTPGEGVFATALGAPCVYMGLAEFQDTATRDAAMEEYARTCGRHRCDSVATNIATSSGPQGGGRGYTDVVWSVDAQALRFVTVASRRQWQQSRKAFDQDILRGKLSDTLAGAVRTEAALIGGAAQSESPSSVRGSLVPAIRGCVPLPGMLPGGVVVFMQLSFPVASADDDDDATVDKSKAESPPKRIISVAAHFAASVNVWATAGGATLSSPTGSSRGLVVHVASEKECWLVQTGTAADVLRDHAVAVGNKSVVAAFQTASRICIDIAGQVEPTVQESIRTFSKEIATETTSVVTRFAQEYCGCIYR